MRKLAILGAAAFISCSSNPIPKPKIPTVNIPKPMAEEKVDLQEKIGKVPSCVTSKRAEAFAEMMIKGCVYDPNCFVKKEENEVSIFRYLKPLPLIFYQESNYGMSFFSRDFDLGEFNVRLTKMEDGLLLQSTMGYTSDAGSGFVSDEYGKQMWKDFRQTLGIISLRVQHENLRINEEDHVVYSSPVHYFVITIRTPCDGASDYLDHILQRQKTEKQSP